MNNQYICLKNTVELLYFILGEANYIGNFPGLLRDPSDIQRFPEGDLVKTL